METTPKTAKFKSVYGTPCDQQVSSPREASVEKPKQQLSASLKARLKRSRRSFTSPLSVAKRLKIEDDDDDDDDNANASSDHTQTTGGQRTLGGQTEHDDINRIRTGPVESSESGCSVGALDPSAEGQAPTGTHPLRRRDQLKREVKERTETLRRLKMVKMYRSKNDLTELRRLIAKWRRCSQAALYELQAEQPVDGRKAGLAQLIDLFGLDDSLLHFDRTEEDFADP